MSSLRSLCTAALVLCATACVEDVSPDPLGEYRAWPMMGGSTHTVQGRAPGHGDTIRVIYVNPIAAMAETISPSYPIGSTIVKEIRDNDNGVAGDIRYIAIMRRQDTFVDEGLENDGGWLFSEQEYEGAPETHRELCWNRCHVAAPYNGAFYDYRTN